MSWAERAAERSPTVQRSKTRGVEQARAIVSAARRLIELKGPTFTTQELVKEAGIALQTFYRYFPGKDHLLVAVIEDYVEENAAVYKKKAARLSGPLERLRFYVTAPIASVRAEGKGPSFITAEHWRLQVMYPDDISRASRPFTELILKEIRDGVAAGLLDPADVEYSAWLVTQLVTTLFHHYDCSGLDEPATLVNDRVWAFCLAALGGKLGERAVTEGPERRRGAPRK